KNAVSVGLDQVPVDVAGVPGTEVGDDDSGGQAGTVLELPGGEDRRQSAGGGCVGRPVAGDDDRLASWYLADPVGVVVRDEPGLEEGRVLAPSDPQMLRSRLAVRTFQPHRDVSLVVGVRNVATVGGH